jgi:ligand-binding SRPBCC domain-containing protein
MADYVHESRVWLARPRQEVFAFFAEPTVLERLTPPALRLRLVNREVTMTVGAVLEFRLRWLGVVPLRWRAFVREWDPPFRFVDVQVRGPYARWEHRHRFLEEGGGTWVEDRVTYRLPLGPLGRVAHALLVKRQLRELWAYRHRQLAELVKLSAPAT